jgi:AcrR family transcriptional regulator
MLTIKTRVRDGRGRPRKIALDARKLPRQARAKETVNVILEASARILESQGLRSFNTNAIATKAGVSVGSLYQYFPNKDSIVRALIGSFEEELLIAVNKAVQSGKQKGMKARITLLVRSLVSVHYRRPRLNCVLEAEEERLGIDAEDAVFHSLVLQLLRGCDHKVAIPASATTEQVAMTILRAVVDMGLRSGMSPALTERRAVRAICGYLCYPRDGESAWRHIQ